MARRVIPLALYEKFTVPGDEIYLRHSAKSIKTERPYHHLKLDLFQMSGFSESQNIGFKTLNLEEINSVRMATCFIEPDDLEVIRNEFKLDTYNNAYYIAQFGQLLEEKYRKEFLRILAKK